jgi:competence transcription factor ComK
MELQSVNRGASLALINSNGGTIAYMKPQIECFEKNYKLIVIDCRGRGNSEFGKDRLTTTVAIFFNEPFIGKVVR